MSLVINNLSKTYKNGIIKRNGNKALRNINMEIKNGEVLALIGQNGAGKTTLIKCILGFLNPDEGEVLLNLKSMQSAISEGNLGYMPETLSYPKYITLKEYINDLMILRGKDINKYNDVLENLINKFYMKEHINKTISKFSKGTQKKASFIQSIIHSPKILILDEPTDGLDPVSRKTLLNEVLELKNKGSIVIITTHILQDINTVADRVIALQNGSIIKDDMLCEINESLEDWYFNLLIENGGLDKI